MKPFRYVQSSLTAKLARSSTISAATAIRAFASQAFPVAASSWKPTSGL